MSFDLHTVSVMSGTSLARQDRVQLAAGSHANAAGSGAGASVTTTVTPGGQLPSKFVPVINPGQDATWYVTNKTGTTFDVVLTPRLAANTLASGSFDYVLIA